MKFYPRTAVVLWVLMLMSSGWIVARHTTVITDLTALLSASADRSQRLLVDQLRDGVASRVILIGLQGGQPEALAEVSRRMARRLKESGLFGYVNNGEEQYSTAERDVLMRHRYLLSPTVTPERFTSQGLREALQSSLRMLGSPAGSLVKRTLPSDPTGEFVQILSTMTDGGGPSSQHGVWFSADGTRAQLVAETLAPGFDLDKQEQAIRTIRQAFADAAPPEGSRLLLSSPGVFAVESRAIIERDSWRLSVIAGVLVVLILFSIYRSASLVVLSMLPVVSGLVVGIAIVRLAFGSVHGITLGFGATLIGEAVDYPTYLFTHIGPGERIRDTLRRIWPTLRLAVLTTVFGSLTMLLSSFTGLSQLGLLSLTGVLVAGLVTRWVIPTLVSDRLTLAKRQALPFDWTRYVRSSRRGMWAVMALLAVSAGLVGLAVHDGRLWDNDLANLSPVSESAKELDKQMRSELGAPDVRYLVVMEGESREDALRRSEEVAQVLRGLVDEQVIAGFDMASQYLPSEQTQKARLAALPEGPILKQALKDAGRGLPFRGGLFSPFLRDVHEARTGGIIDAGALKGSALSIKVQTLLYQRGGQWVALAPLRGVHDQAKLAAGLNEMKHRGALLLDLKAESNRLVNGYRNEALRLTLLGLVAIVLALAWGLRSPVLVWRVLAPVLTAVVIDVALLLTLGIRLTLFHLVSLLLVIGIGLNYALFFNRRESDSADTERTALSLTACSLATLAAFGTLAFSATPVLHAIGLTVALGSLLALVVSAVLAHTQVAYAR